MDKEVVGVMFLAQMRPGGRYPEGEKVSMPKGEVMSKWHVAAITMLAVVTLGTRLPAPWRVDVLSDEMIHLESWRNRYRTSDMLPIFRHRLAEARLGDSQKGWLASAYESSPLFQRLLFVHADSASPAYGALAESIEIASHSSLTALRMPSLIASVAAVALMYLLGRTLATPALGLWLATLLALTPLSQVYAGIGRPHGPAQFALIALVYTYCLDRKQDRSPLGRFLVVALLAQLSHWTTWGIVGPLVASEVMRRYLAGATPGQLLRQTWWYVALSLALLVVFVVQRVGSTNQNAASFFQDAGSLFYSYCVASPFEGLSRFGDGALWAGGFLYQVLIACGIVRLLIGGPEYREVRWPLLAACTGSILSSYVMTFGIRYNMIFNVMPLIMAGIGAYSLFPSRLAATVGALALLASGLLLQFWLEDPYKHLIANDARYSQIADRLARELQPGDPWVSFPYYYADALYRYARLPEPILPRSSDEFRAAVDGRPKDRPTFVLMFKRVAEEHPDLLRQATMCEYYNDLVYLVKLPPRSEPGDP